MNPAQQALARAATVLQQFSPGGEVVTYEDSEILRAVVNRQPERNQPPGMQDVSTKDGSIIELDRLTQPKQGDVITDSMDYEHSVRTVKYIGQGPNGPRWRLECEVVR